MKGVIVNIDATDDGLIQLVYASAAAVPFEDDELQQLLSVARRNNEAFDVSGVLLFKDQTFLQVLEGKRDAVHELYTKIERDPRHNNVLLLAKSEIEERNFADWKMGFVCDGEVISQLSGFVDFFGTCTFLDLHGNASRIRNVLAGFKRGRWRRQCDAATSA